MKWIWATLIAMVCGTALGASIPKASTSMRDVKNTRPQATLMAKAMGEGTFEVDGKRARYGRFKVVNRTYSVTVDVWLTLHDGYTDWYYLGTVGPRRWNSWKIRRSWTNGIDYYVAGLDQENQEYNANNPDWGPRAFWLNKSMVWTLWL